MSGVHTVSHDVKCEKKCRRPRGSAFCTETETNRYHTTSVTTTAPHISMPDLTATDGPASPPAHRTTAIRHWLASSRRRRRSSTTAAPSRAGSAAPPPSRASGWAARRAAAAAWRPRLRRRRSAVCCGGGRRRRGYPVRRGTQSGGRRARGRRRAPSTLRSRAARGRCLAGSRPRR